ncbi:MAG TPA: glycosyltransferase family 4 protein, partial [candidate division Zixibacteria bacterium]|nr:glycosyltransferase family 4 protein [candidate division Zixibacteria bacterium]
YLLRKEKNNFMIALITRWAEGILQKKADLFTAVSEADAHNLKRIYGADPLLLPNGVNDGSFDSVTDEQIRGLRIKYDLGGRIILFMGLPSFKPNKEAIQFLIDDVMPLLTARCPDVKLAIIGGEVKHTREWLITPGNIPFEDVPIFIKSCDICVAPIFSGSGTRLKILEYMAAGKPVVSSTKGAEGIGVIDGINILISDTSDGFIEKILYLFENPDFGVNIGSEGRKMVKARYSWQKIMQDFNGILNASFNIQMGQ